ncbi:MAG: hypothetical protein ACOX9C_12415 [Kiritimatiellia bacterium]
MTSKRNMTHRLPSRRIAAATLGAFLSAAMSVRSQTAPGVKEFDRSTAELTASLLLTKLQDDVLGSPPEPAVLEAEMDADPGKYTDPSEAKRKLQRHYRDAMVVRYRQEAAKYLDRIAGADGRESVFAPEFLAAAVALPADRLDAIVDAGYDATFAKARVNACAKQAAALIADIKPDEREFDEIPRDRLSAIMTERVAAAQRKPVFLENFEHITRNLVAPMLAAAETQREAQRTFLARHPVEGWTPGRIGAGLAMGLTNFVAESAPRHREAGRVAYGIFPSVVAAVPSVAEGRAIDKFARVVDETEPVVDEAAILAALQRSPREHRTAKDSLHAFAPVLSTTLVKEALARSIPLVPEGEQAAFDGFAKTALDHEKVNQTVSNRVVKVLAPKLANIRAEAAQQQMARWFPSLVSGEWFPSPTLVDFIGEAVDYRKTLQGWRELPDLARFVSVAKREALFVETDARLDGDVREAFDRGQRARVRQHRIVDDVFEPMRTLLRTEGGDLDQSVAVYTEKVSAVWAEDRGAVLWSGWEGDPPPNASRQHEALFPSTVEKIRLKVKSILESIENEKNPEKPPVEDPPETPPQTPPPPPELKQITLDCRYEITRKGGEIVVSLFTADERRGTVVCPHEPKAYRRRRAVAVADAVTCLTDELRRHTDKGDTVELVVDVIVRDDLVYYGIVATLVEALNAKTPEFAETGVNMKVNESKQE